MQLLCPHLLTTRPLPAHETKFRPKNVTSSISSHIRQPLPAEATFSMLYYQPFKQAQEKAPQLSHLF